MSEPEPPDLEGRVLVLAPTTRDAAVSRDILAAAGIATFLCKDIDAICTEMARGCGAVLVTQEAILADRSRCLGAVLASQPPWSDFPLLVIMPPGAQASRALEVTGHMTLLQRPIAIAGLVSAIRTALRDRRRQYELRDQFAQRERDAEALRRSEEDLRLMVESVKDYAIVSLDTSGRIALWNKGARRLFGYDDAEVVGHDVAILFTPEDRAGGIPRLELDEAAASGHAEDERWHRRKDGSRFFASGIVTPIRDAAGTLRGFTKVARDVTERMRADEALRDREGQLRFALEVGKLGSWQLDIPTRTLTCSDLCKGNYGRPPGVPFTYDDLFEAIDPEDRPRVRELIERAIAGRVDFEAEYRTTWPDGGTHWVLVRGRGEYGADGAPLRMTGLSLDVTERARAAEERERLLSRERALGGQLRRLAEIAAGLNAAKDIDSVLRIVTEQARALIGTRRSVTSMAMDQDWARAFNCASAAGEPGGCRFYDGMPDDSGIVSLVGRSDRPVRMTRAADGPPSRGWLAAPLITRDGRNFGLVQLSDKVRGEFTEDDEAIVVQLAQMASVAIENAKLYEELKVKDRRKDEFLAMLAHELRNPLASISNAVQLSQVAGYQDQIEWSMNVISRQIKHLARLIDDLLDVSRITRGKIRLRKEVVDARPIVDGAVEVVRPLVEERRHELTVTFPTGDLWLDADPTRLEQILVNLLTNAAKYSENGGRISVVAGREGDEIAIAVRDEGVGIPPDKLPQMFELFAQGDRSLARSEGGLGIGLTLVRSLAEMHGGGVTARSEGPGKGSEFLVRLPACPPPAQAIPARPARPAGAIAKASRILVVDDNVDTARGMAKLLKLLGHDVRTAHDGPGAIEAALAYRPEFILLDIGLPGMDGYQVSARIRAEDSCRDAVIIAVSGYGQDDDRRRSREAGFDHHLVKPIDQDALLTLLGRPDLAP